MKLQDAYASETNALGKWVAIGYKAPGGTTLHMLAEMPLPRSLVQLVPMMRPQANVKMEKP